jgi:hypothetical protein
MGKGQSQDKKGSELGAALNAVFHPVLLILIDSEEVTYRL